MDKRKKTGKRILSTVLAAVVTFPLLVGMVAKDMSKVQAAATLRNPRRADNGVVTWDCVYFGRYPQSDATGTKSDPIKWRVLSVNGKDAFLVADCNLDAQFYYDNVFEKTTWENCTIRSWLNGYGGDSNSRKKDYRWNNFIDRAFMNSEQNAILTTTIVNPGNTTYKIAGGNDTKDKIFLLSFEEVTNPAYGFAVSPDERDPARVRVDTAYVAAGGSTGDAPLLKKVAGESDQWWLRSPGRFLNNAMTVGSFGTVIQDYGNVDHRYAVCPALHLNLSDSKLWSHAGTVSSDGSSTKGEVPPSVEVEVKDSTGAVYVQTDDKNKTVEYHTSSTSSTSVVVPETVTIKGTTYKVTSVSDNAFKNNKKIKKVVIGSSVKTIGKNAFRGCTNLQTVTIGRNVKTIGENAFMGCSNLQTVTIGNNVTAIHAKAFYKCKKLKKITIPSKVNKIGKQAFYGCKNLKTITIKTTKLTSKKVGSKAFKGIYSKTVIKVPAKKLSAYKKMLKSKGVGSKASIKK